MARGGYQQPANPAPVSGPGAMSARTDGGPRQPIRPVTGLSWGENQELNTVQASAPMAAAPSVEGQPAAPLVPLADMSPNLFDPTAYPDRPVTTGMLFGPGPGLEVLGAPVQSMLQRSLLVAALPTLLRAAESDEVSPEFRQLVAMVRGAALG